MCVIEGIIINNVLAMIIAHMIEGTYDDFWTHNLTQIYKTKNQPINVTLHF